MKVKAVLFDLFETLITEFSNGGRIAARSYHYTEGLGLSKEEFRKEWSNRQQRRMTGQFPNYHAVVKDIAESHSLPYNAEAVEHLYRERLEEKMLPFREIRPDIIELLQFLRNRHLKIGLISNCTEEEVKGWPNSRLAAYFDDVVFSYEVGLAKPDPGIYKLACSRLAVMPEETIFIGDGGSQELDGANRAGMKAYHAFWYNTHVKSEYTKLLAPGDLIGEI